MNIVFFVGITGTEKKPVVNRNLVASLSEAQREKLAIFCVEDRFPQVEEDLVAWMEDPNPQSQQQVWAKAFDTIITDLQNLWDQHNDPDTVFISMHCAFHRKMPFCPVRLEKLRELARVGDVSRNRVTFISLMNDSYETRQKIVERNAEDPTGSEFRLREIITWRIHDTILTDIWAQELEQVLPTEHFILAVRHHKETLRDLLFEPSKTRAYIGFPISSTRDSTESRAGIDSFRTRLRDIGLTVFDPLTMDELVLEHAYNTQESGPVVLAPGSRWEISLADTLLDAAPQSVSFPLELPRDEVAEVVKDLNKQVEWRDFRYIQQANCLVVYRPYWGKSPHTGVKSEMDHARHLRKRIFLYFPPEDGSIDDSPFSDFGQAYTNIDDMYLQLERFVASRA